MYTSELLETFGGNVSSILDSDVIRRIKSSTIQKCVTRRERVNIYIYYLLFVLLSFMVTKTTARLHNHGVLLHGYGIYHNDINGPISLGLLFGSEGVTSLPKRFRTPTKKTVCSIM